MRLNLNVLTELELNMIVEFAGRNLARKQVLGIMMSQPCPAPASEDSARTPRSVSRSRRDTHMSTLSSTSMRAAGPFKLRQFAGGFLQGFVSPLSPPSNLLPPPPVARHPSIQSAASAATIDFNSTVANAAIAYRGRH